MLVDLKEHGGDIPVSKANVEEYIEVSAAAPSQATADDCLQS